MSRMRAQVDDAVPQEAVPPAFFLHRHDLQLFIISAASAVQTRSACLRFLNPAASNTLGLQEGSLSSWG